jgi:hypothetical protein
MTRRGYGQHHAMNLRIWFAQTPEGLSDAGRWGYEANSSGSRRQAFDCDAAPYGSEGDSYALQVGHAHTDEVSQPIVAAHQTGTGVP